MKWIWPESRKIRMVGGFDMPEFPIVDLTAADSGFTPREASMIRVALREKAAAYERLTRGRKWAGPENADVRARARAEAVAYRKLADDRRLRG